MLIHRTCYFFKNYYLIPFRAVFIERLHCLPPASPYLTRETPARGNAAAPLLGSCWKDTGSPPQAKSAHFFPLTLFPLNPNDTPSVIASAFSFQDRIFATSITITMVRIIQLVKRAHSEMHCARSTLSNG